MYACLEEKRIELLDGLGSECRPTEWQDSLESLEALTDVLHLLAIEQWQVAHAELSPAPGKRRGIAPSLKGVRVNTADELAAVGDQRQVVDGVVGCVEGERQRSPESVLERCDSERGCHDSMSGEFTPSTAALMAKAKEYGGGDNSGSTGSSFDGGTSWRLRRDKMVARPGGSAGMEIEPPDAHRCADDGGWPQLP